MKKIRLDRLLGNLGYGSRKDVQDLVKKRAVTIDGGVVTDFSQHIEISSALCERIQVEGEGLDPMPGMVLMLHKPVGYTCSHKEEGEIVYDLFPGRWTKRNPPLSSVGRLDKDTSGLLLLTDDGDLLHKLSSPKHQIEKKYRAILDRPLRGDEAEIFASGTLLLESEKKPLLPARLEVIGEKIVHLYITEGRYHQVRRMFAAVGNHVTELHRVRIGGLELPETLESGEFLFLNEQDLAKIFQ